MTLKFCSLIEKHFIWKNHAENVHQKLDPDPFLILLNNAKQLLHARTYFKNTTFLKKDYQKALKKVHFIFSFGPSPF